MEVLPTMRIYGSSPLYNYVELIFRCKRLFIVSIILGTVIISTFAYTRPTHYDASLLVALAGKADVVRPATNNPNDPDNAKYTTARKAEHLQIWLQMYTQVLERADAHAQHDKRRAG